MFSGIENFLGQVGSTLGNIWNAGVSDVQHLFKIAPPPTVGGPPTRPVAPAGPTAAQSALSKASTPITIQNSPAATLADTFKSMNLNAAQQKSAQFLEQNGLADPNYKSPSTGIVGDAEAAAKGIATQAAQGVASIPLTLAATGGEIAKNSALKGLNLPTEYNFKPNSIPAKIFGTHVSPIVSSGGTEGGGQANQLAAWLQEHGVNKTLANASTIPISGILAALTVGGPKGEGSAIDGIVKAGTPEDVHAVLQSHIGPAADTVPQSTLNTLAKSKDPQEIQQVLQNHFQNKGATEPGAAGGTPTQPQISPEAAKTATPGPASAPMGDLGKVLDNSSSSETITPPGNPVKPPSPQLQAARELMDQTGQTSQQLKAQVSSMHENMIRTELSNMLQELRAGKVEQGGLIRDTSEGTMTSGNVTGRYGRFSSNPEWYKQMYRTSGITKPRIESAIAAARPGSPVYQQLRDVAVSRLEGRYTDPMTGPVPANTKFLGAQHVLKGIDEHQAAPAEMSPADLQWAKDNGFAPQDLPFKTQDEKIAAEQAAANRPGPKMQEPLSEIHQPMPVRSTPETPLLSDQHMDIPGKAPVDIKQPQISLTPPKNENSLVKGFGTIKTVIRRQGAAGKELATRMTNVRETHAELGQAFRDSIPTVLKLNKGAEFKNFADTVEGKGAPMNAKVAKAAGEWQATTKAVEARAGQAGISMGHIEDYFPHMYDNKLFTDKKTFTAAAEHLVNSGQATDLQNAVQQINQMREPWQGGNRFGNLEKARNADIPGYRTDKSVVTNYLDKAARRIAEAEQFGPDNEHVDRLVAEAAKEGKDANAMQQAFNAYWQRPANGALAKIGEGTRKVTNVLTLSKAAISHSMQTVNTAIVAGNMRTAASWVKSLSPETRAMVKKMGINYDSAAGPRISGTAPLLKQMRAQNRIVSAIAGMKYGDALARAGKTDELVNRWGVQGPIGKTLTDAQRTHMAHAMADKTQFSDDPADLPMWARTPGGKAVGQYRMSYQYKQGGFLFDNLIKEAGKGNLMPLVRAGILIPMAGAAVVEAKHLLGNQATPTSDPMATIEAGGGGNAVTSTLDSARYIHDGQSAVENIAGAAVPAAGEIATTAYNVHDALGGNTTPIGKQVLGYVPFIGGLVKNAVYKPADPNAIAYTQLMSQAGGTLKDSKDQAIFNALFGSNKDAYGNKIPASYDPNNSPYVAEALLSHPNVLAAATQFYQAFAQKTGQAIDPVYSLPPAQQQAALEIRAASAFPGELSGDKKQLATELPTGYQQQQTDYYNAISASLAAAGQPTTQPGAPTYPTPSAQVQAELNAGITNTPEAKAWYTQLDQYNNQRRAMMGLPQIATYGFGPSTGQIPNPSDPYATKTVPGTSPNPTFAKSSSSSSGYKSTSTKLPKIAGMAKVSKTGKITIPKGAAPKTIKMPSIKVASAPKVSAVKTPKIASAKAVKVPSVPMPTHSGSSRLKLSTTAGIIRAPKAPKVSTSLPKVKVAKTSIKVPKLASSTKLKLPKVKKLA